LIATAEYGKLRERKSVLPEIVALTEAIGGMMATYAWPLSSLYHARLTKNL